MDPFDAVDASVIEELMRIKHEDEVIADRLLKMAEMRDQVTASVYAKVESDYRQRAAALEEQARPLKQRARVEHRKLVAIHDRLAAEREQARLDREEQELRYKIGEYDEPAYGERIAAASSTLQRREEEVAAAEALAARFLAAFRSPEELASEGEPRPTAAAAEAEAPPAEPPFAALPAPPLAVVSPPSPESTRPLPSTSSPFATEAAPTPVVPAPPGAPLPDEEGESTVLLPQRQPAAEAKPAIETTSVLPESDGTGGVTTVLPTARLTAHGEPGGMEYVLGTVTMVGRTLENQIRLAKPAISRRHCQIVLTPDGRYTITDLQSENGVYVNGERINERVLADGDLVQIGTERFVFQAH